MVALLLGGVAAMLLRAAGGQPWMRFLAAALGLVAANFGATVALASDVDTTGASAATSEELANAPGWPRALAKAGLVFLVLDPLFFAYAASLVPQRRGIAADRRLLALAVAAAVGLIVLVVVDLPSVCCRPPPRTGLVPYPGRIPLVAYVTAMYAFTLWTVWRAYARERSDVMARQLDLLAVGITLPLLTRIALAYEDLRLGLGLSHLAHVAVFLLALGATLLALRRASLARADGPRRPEVRASWWQAALVLAALVPFGLLPDLRDAVAAAAPGRPLDPAVAALADWTFSARWLAFGFYLLPLAARTAAFDARPQDLRRALSLSLALAVGLGVAVVGLLAGLAPAAAAAALAAFGLLEWQRRPAQDPASPVEARPPRAPSGEASEETRAGGLAATLEAPPDRAGPYRLLREVGRGALGIAYLAEHPGSGEKVVAKRLRVQGEGLDGLAREVRVAKRVSHPNLVAIHDLVEDAGHTWLVEEYVEGGDLRRLLRQGPPRLSEGARLGQGLLDGLAALHEAGIVHGDLKPANVLLGTGGPKLADFGIAQLPSGPPVPGGTLAYLAPERLRGGGATKASDVYAAGLVLHELLTGRHPLGSAVRGEGAMRRQVQQARPLGPLPGIPGPVAGVLRRALRPEPRERYPEAGAMARAFAAAWAEAGLAR